MNIKHSQFIIFLYYGCRVDVKALLCGLDRRCAKCGRENGHCGICCATRICADIYDW